MPAPPRLETVYTDDESLAIRCDGDYTILAPNSNQLAAGADGVFASGQPWTLTSATVDFEAQGVGLGNTIHLSTPRENFGASGTLFGVSEASGHSITLRRLGLDVGVGQPPAPSAGLTNVKFEVRTLAPQIEQASDDINRRFGITPGSVNYDPSRIFDLRELAEATMLEVLVRKYVSDVRTKDGAYYLKLTELRTARDAAFSRLAIKWGDDPDAPAPPSPVFGMRVSR